MKSLPKSWHPRLPEPTFTEEEKKWARTVLRAAKKHLAKDARERGQGKESMVCLAVGRVVEHRDAQQQEIDIADKINRLLKARLQGAPSMRSWLTHRGYPAHSEEPAVVEKVQQARHDWVDALIKEFESGHSSEESPRRGGNVQVKRRKARVDHERSFDRWYDDLGHW